MSISVTPVGIYDYSRWYDQYQDYGLVLFQGVNTYPSGVAALQELEEKVLKQL
jgi:hypothetical protein